MNAEESAPTRSRHARPRWRTRALISSGVTQSMACARTEPTRTDCEAHW